MGCSPSTHQLQGLPAPGRLMATYPFHPTFQRSNRLFIYSEDVTTLSDDLPPPHQPPTQKSDIYDPEKFKAIDRRAIMAPEELLRQPYPKLIEFLLEGLSGNLEKVRVLFSWVTALPLESMEIGREPNPFWPLHQLWRIKEQKGNYAQLMMTLCRLADIPCVIIHGLMKGSTYQLGQQVERDELYGEWNAVLIDDHWRFLNAYWAACAVDDGDKDDNEIWHDLAKLRTKKRKAEMRTVYACDENYFLTDPDQMSASHFPKVKEWQLLDKPMSLTDFQEMAFLKDRFFNFNMSLITHSKCLIRCLSGEVDIRFAIPRENSDNLKFHCILSQSETDVVPSVGGNMARKCGHVFLHKVQPDILSVEVRIPTAGTYRLELIGKDCSINDPGYEYDWVVLFKIVADSVSENCGPYPLAPPIGWGAGLEASQLRLLPKTHTSGRIRTSNGNVEIRFKIVDVYRRNAQFSHRLYSNDAQDSSLADHVVHWVDQDEVVFSVRTPRKDEYGLSLFVREDAVGSAEDNFCNYVIVSERESKNGAFPRDFGRGAGVKTGLKDMCVKTVSHGNSVIFWHREELEIVFELGRPIELFAALSGSGIKAADSKRLVSQVVKEKMTTFKIRFPHDGTYGLKVVGMDPTAAQCFQSVYDYLIVLEKKRSRRKEPIPEVATPVERKLEEKVQMPDMPDILQEEVIEIGNPPKQQELDIDNTAQSSASNENKKCQAEEDHLKNLSNDPRYVAIRQRVHRGISEQNEEDLQNTLDELYEYDVPDSNPMVNKVELELRLIRSRNELREGFASKDVEMLKSAIDNLKHRQLETELRKDMLRAHRILDRHANIQRLLHDVMELDQKTISEVRKYTAPPAAVINIMQATLLLLGYFEEETQDWKDILLVLGKVGTESLHKRIQEFVPESMPLDIALGAKELLREITLEKMRTISASAAAFLVWTRGIVKDIEDRAGDEIKDVRPRTSKTRAKGHWNTDVAESV